MNYKFGKRPAIFDPKTLRLSKYVKDLAPPPDSFDNLKVVYDKLKINDPKELFLMDGNDTHGDCVCAAIAHAITIYNGLIGKYNVPDPKDVVNLYDRLEGCKGDVGLNMLKVMKKWRKKSFLGEKILAFAAIDPKDHLSIRHCIHLFGGCLIGFNVQANVITDFDNRIMWTPGTLTGEGHCVDTGAYYIDYVDTLTWGNDQKGNWPWVDETWDEAYAIIPPEAEDPSFAPGFPFAELMDDLKYVTR